MMLPVWAGRTWLARLHGIGEKGVDRTFVDPATGRVGYPVTDGLYESNTGPLPEGRRYWLVRGEDIEELDRRAAFEMLEKGRRDNG